MRTRKDRLRKERIAGKIEGSLGGGEIWGYEEQRGKGVRERELAKNRIFI